MKRRHPWAALQDFTGNLWCALWHEAYWTREDPEWVPRWYTTNPLANLYPLLYLGASYCAVGTFLISRRFGCRRCGRRWMQLDNGKYLALPHPHLDQARLEGLSPEAWNAYYVAHHEREEKGR